MATSPIYNWPEPDNTDLVKNGALAIRTLGNAIDTTMATMVPKTIVDAKGDLIAGTAADTAARLAVGNNGETLVADSSTATGLKWAAPSSGGSAQVAGKNAIINGDFLINQRGFTSNTTDNTYNFDRWFQQSFGGTYTLTPQTFTPGTAPVATYEGRNYLQAISASQSAAGHLGVVTQRIEDATRYAGATVTVSFFAKANTGTPKIGVELYRNYGTGGSPSASESVNASSITLTTSWARYSVTFAVPSLSGKTLGTTANTSYLELCLWQSAGANYNARASSIGIQNFTLSLWGVQVEYGSSATYFTTATGTLQGELSAAQRYYYRVSDASSTYWRYGQGNGESTTVAQIQFQCPTTMRVRPTAMEYSNFGLVDGSAAYTGGTWAINTNRSTSTSVTADYTHGSAALTQKQSYGGISAGTASSYIAFTAEL